eukprot:1186823-Prorocentrum_minimum.AAC.3
MSGLAQDYTLHAKSQQVMFNMEKSWPVIMGCAYTFMSGIRRGGSIYPTCAKQSQSQQVMFNMEKSWPVIMGCAYTFMSDIR